MSNENVWYKKWWVWVIIVILFIIGAVQAWSVIQKSNREIERIEKETNDEEKQTQEATVSYRIIGETLGEYGKVITLNKNSDMPAKKYVYKLPAGTYIVTTTFDKMASFFIVKDKVAKTGTGAYVEEMNYVGDSYLLTAGDNDFNGSAKDEVTIELKSDESIQIVGSNTFIFTKQ